MGYEQTGNRLGFLSWLKGTTADDTEIVQQADNKPSSARRVLDFLRSAGLEPTPENYQFSWEYTFGASARFRQAVDDIVDEHGHLTTPIAQQITAKYLDQWNAETIAELISGGRQVLNKGGKLIRRSHDDNKSYAAALEKELETIDPVSADANCHITALVSLTKAMVIKSIETQKELEAAGENLADMRRKLADATEQAEKDQLTGLPNRWAFEKHLEDAVLRSRQTMEPLSVAFVDIDHFKAINDTHGHDTGDRVLRRIAQSLDQLSDARCHVARHGGEEFVILFSDIGSEQAQTIVDEAREELTSHDFTNQQTGQKIGKVSFSAGVSSLTSDCDPRAMLRRADAALYQAKESGRDQVIIHP